jgi:Zn-dependent protease
VFEAPPSVGFSQIVISQHSELASTGALLLSVLFSMNLMLAVLNMIPVPPLDGSGAIGLLLSEDAARRYNQAVTGSGLAIIGLVIAWQISWVIFRPIFLFSVNLLHPGFSYG